MENNVDSAISKLRQKPLLSVKDIQKILDIGRTSAYTFLHNNPPFRVIYINNTIRIPSKDIFDWIDGNKKNAH